MKIITTGQILLSNIRIIKVFKITGKFLWIFFSVRRKFKLKFELSQAFELWNLELTRF
jgi:hypothetical protein